jgi:hypothetical protein
MYEIAFIRIRLEEEADRRVERSAAVDKLKVGETEGLFGECDGISVRADRAWIVLSVN